MDKIQGFTNGSAWVDSNLELADQQAQRQALASLLGVSALGLLAAKETPLLCLKCIVPGADTILNVTVGLLALAAFTHYASNFKCYETARNWIPMDIVKNFFPTYIYAAPTLRCADDAGGGGGGAVEH